MLPRDKDWTVHLSKFVPKFSAQSYNHFSRKCSFQLSSLSFSERKSVQPLSDKIAVYYTQYSILSSYVHCADLKHDLMTTLHADSCSPLDTIHDTHINTHVFVYHNNQHPCDDNKRHIHCKQTWLVTVIRLIIVGPRLRGPLVSFILLKYLTC